MSDIIKIIHAKEIAQNKIAAALKEFTETTEHRVSSVSISKFETFEQIMNYKEYQVELEVKVILQKD